VSGIVPQKIEGGNRPAAHRKFLAVDLAVAVEATVESEWAAGDFKRQAVAGIPSDTEASRLGEQAIVVIAVARRLPA